MVTTLTHTQDSTLLSPIPVFLWMSSPALVVKRVRGTFKQVKTMVGVIINGLGGLWAVVWTDVSAALSITLYYGVLLRAWPQYGGAYAVCTLCYVVIYEAALCYKRLLHTNPSTWLQGHQSANQPARHWRACLHGKHCLHPFLLRMKPFFFFLLPSVYFISNHEVIWKRKHGEMHPLTCSTKSPRSCIDNEMQKRKQRADR